MSQEQILIYSLSDESGFIEIMCTDEDRVLKSYIIKSINRETKERLTIEKYFTGHDQAIERAKVYCNNLLGLDIKGEFKRAA